MVDRRPEGREGDLSRDRPEEYAGHPGMGIEGNEPGNMNDFRLRGGQPTPPAWDLPQDPGGVNRGMGYASPQGYRSPVSGPTPAGREAVREYEARRVGRTPVAARERMDSPESHLARQPDLRSSARSSLLGGSGAGLGIKGIAAALATLGLVFLAVWLVASLNLQFGWPTGLFITGLVLLIGAGIAWVAARSKTNGSWHGGRGH